MAGWWDGPILLFEAPHSISYASKGQHHTDLVDIDSVDCSQPGNDLVVGVASWVNHTALTGGMYIAPVGASREWMERVTKEVSTCCNSTQLFYNLLESIACLVSL